VRPSISPGLAELVRPACGLGQCPSQSVIVSVCDEPPSGLRGKKLSPRSKATHSPMHLSRSAQGSWGPDWSILQTGAEKTNHCRPVGQESELGPAFPTLPGVCVCVFVCVCVCVTDLIKLVE
jgi:hypothetical protein